MKVLGANTSLPYEMFQKIKELSDKEFFHNQFRVICRCKGMIDGNKKCELAGLGSRVFTPGWTSITGNRTELELCEREDIWVRIGGSNYVSIRDLQ